MKIQIKIVMKGKLLFHVLLLLLKCKSNIIPNKKFTVRIYIHLLILTHDINIRILYIYIYTANHEGPDPELLFSSWIFTHRFPIFYILY